MTETLERLTRPTFQRTGPFWYYAPILILGLFPWSLVALARIPGWIRSMRRWLPRPSADRGLVLASAAIVLFFSISRSKLGGYVLPAFPLLAILLAREIERIEAHRRAWTFVPGATLLAVGGACAWASRDGLALAERLHQPEGLAGAIAGLFLAIGCASAAAGIALILLRLLRREGIAPIPLAILFPAILLLAYGSIRRYVDENSSMRIASAVRSLGGPVVAYRCFPVGLDYYLDRIVPVVTETGREITSTFVERDFGRITGRRKSVWSPADFEERLASDPAEPLVLISRQPYPPVEGYALQATYGRYRIWTPAAPGAR
jgi:hypothetical protein